MYKSRGTGEVIEVLDRSKSIGQFMGHCRDHSGSEQVKGHCRDHGGSGQVKGHCRDHGGTGQVKGH